MLSRFSCVQLFATLWIVAHQPPLCTGFPRQEYWSGLLFLPPGDLPDPGIEPASLRSPAWAARIFTTSTTGETHSHTELKWLRTGLDFVTPKSWLSALVSSFFLQILPRHKVQLKASLFQEAFPAGTSSPQPPWASVQSFVGVPV